MIVISTLIEMTFENERDFWNYVLGPNKGPLGDMQSEAFQKNAKVCKEAPAPEHGLKNRIEVVVRTVKKKSVIIVDDPTSPN